MTQQVPACTSHDDYASAPRSNGPPKFEYSKRSNYKEYTPGGAAALFFSGRGLTRLAPFLLSRAEQRLIWPEFFQAATRPFPSARHAMPACRGSSSPPAGSAFRSACTRMCRQPLQHPDVAKAAVAVVGLVHMHTHRATAGSFSF